MNHDLTTDCTQSTAPDQPWSHSTCGTLQCQSTMAISINPYGYDPSMLAVVNAVSSQEDQRPAPPPSPAPSSNKASIPPEGRCPILTLPYELRAQIMSYILPYTIFSPAKEVVWLRGHTAALSTCRVIYEECMGIFYGQAEFLIDVHFDRIVFDYQWLVANNDLSKANYDRKLGPEFRITESSHNLIPSRKFDFLSHFSPELRGMMRSFVVRLHVVDGYDGMIMYNTSKEEVLMSGMVKQLGQFWDEITLKRRAGRPRICSKLLGNDRSRKLFKKLCSNGMTTVCPGWLLSLFIGYGNGESWTEPE